MNLNSNNDNMQIPNRSNFDLEKSNDKSGNEFSRSNNLIVNQSQNLNLYDNNKNNNNDNNAQNKDNSKLEDFKLNKSDNNNPNNILSKSDNNPNYNNSSNNNIISNKISQDPLNKIDDNENKQLNNPIEIQEAEKPKVFTNLNFKEEGEAGKNLIEENNAENNNLPQNAFFNQKPVAFENKIQKQFKNIFGGNDYFENNYYRKRVMYLTIFCILVDILHLQVLCLYFNSCFGEYIEMQRWISHTIAPMGVILLLVYIVIYFAADFISKIILQAFNLILIEIMLLYAIFGIYAIVLATQQSPESPFIKNAWTLLSAYSKIYYYDNDIKVLYNSYFLRMLVTGSVYLFIFVCGFFLIVFSYIYTEKIDFIWRPPLRSKLRDERAQRYIDYYGMYNKEYKMLLEMHNQDQKALNSNNINNNNVVNTNNNNHQQQENVNYNNYNSNPENAQLINDNNLNYNSNNNNNNYSNSNKNSNNKNFVNENNYSQPNYEKSKLASQANAASNDASGNNKILQALERNNKSDSKKNLLSNENKIINSNIDSNQISRGSLDKNNNARNSNDNSIGNNLINNADERSNILDNKPEAGKKNLIPPRKLVRRNKNN